MPINGFIIIHYLQCSVSPQRIELVTNKQDYSDYSKEEPALREPRVEVANRKAPAITKLFSARCFESSLRNPPEGNLQLETKEGRSGAKVL